MSRTLYLSDSQMRTVHDGGTRSIEPDGNNEEVRHSPDPQAYRPSFPPTSAGRVVQDSLVRSIGVFG
jgi:hypothetical protein